MLNEQTLDQLHAMKLFGMARYLRQWLDQPKEKTLSPAELAGLLVDAEWIYRENRRLELRLKNAKFKHAQACVEDVDYAHPRGLTKAVLVDLAGSRWVQAHQNIIFIGPTGIGKSWLACALGQKACRDGYSVIYRRVSRLLDEMSQARADGTYPALLRRLARANVLVLDDFGTEPLGPAQRRDLLEIVEDRYKSASTVVTSQLDTDHWHAIIGDATVADSICDRLIHNAHRLKLDGESVRKVHGLTTGDKSTK